MSVTMISKKTFIASVLMMAAATAAVSAKEVTVTRSFRNFKEIEVDNAVSVIYQQSRCGSSEYTLTITADEKVIGNVITDQKEDKVTVKVKNPKNVRRRASEIKVLVRTPELTDIELSGASSFNAGKIYIDRDIEISAKGASTVDIVLLKAQDIEVEAKGASTVKLGSVKADNLEVEAKGASTVFVSGNADIADYEASGASSVKAAALRAQRGSAKASGASTVVCSIAYPSVLSNTGASSVKNK